MNAKEQIDKAVEILNEAYGADPAAIHALVNNHVPCNIVLADHPTIVVGDALTIHGKNFWIGTMGLLNGVLEGICGEKIAHKWSDPDEKGERKLLGFVRYEKPAAK